MKLTDPRHNVETELCRRLFQCENEKNQLIKLTLKIRVHSNERARTKVDILSWNKSIKILSRIQWKQLMYVWCQYFPFIYLRIVSEPYIP